MIGLMKILLEKNAIRSGFIDEHTEGFSNLCDHIRSISWAKILKDTGLEMEEIQKGWRILRLLKGYYCLLGHGAHATQARCCNDSGTYPIYY